MYLHKHCNYMSAYYIIIMIVIWILINVSKKKMMLNLNKTLTTKTTDNQIEQKKIICEQRKKNWFQFDLSSSINQYIYILESSSHLWFGQTSFNKWMNEWIPHTNTHSYSKYMGDYWKWKKIHNQIIKISRSFYFTKK